jgi:hypothetical protein
LLHLEHGRESGHTPRVRRDGGLLLGRQLAGWRGPVQIERCIAVTIVVDQPLDPAQRRDCDHAPRFLVDVGLVFGGQFGGLCHPRALGTYFI